MDNLNTTISKDTRPLEKVLPEALIVGLLLIIFVIICSYVVSAGTYPDFSKGVFADHYPSMYISLLLAGGLFHLTAEYTGANSWFCKNAKYY